MAVGVFTVNLTNSAGCDSTVVSTVTILPSDTVIVASQSCDPSKVGDFEEILINQFGCDSLVLLTISLLPADSCELEEASRLEVYVPNVFSPNGDGVNDFFQFYVNEYAERIQSLQVYNRWGERVYEAYDLSPNDPVAGWDGTFRGRQLDAGLFIFWGEVMDIDGRVVMVMGDVSLVR